MKVLVFGKTGQVGTELQRRFQVNAVGRDVANLAFHKSCSELIVQMRPDVIINAAAYTAVDKAEDDPLAYVINGEAPAAMAEAAASLKIPFVHISTDYVFDGTGTVPWSPCDATNPVNIYGKSKLAGEIGVRAAGGVYAILRTSWVFSAHGANFVKTMLRLSETNDRLGIVKDQIGGPTPATAIADACIKIACALIQKPEKSGTYHLSGAPEVSWADFASDIFSLACKSTLVERIPSSSYPMRAKRPTNSRLDCTSLKDTFGIVQPNWQESLFGVLQELRAI